jgi:hypothetical protein
MGTHTVCCAVECPVLAYSVEELISPSGTIASQKIDLTGRPLLNAARSGDGS